MRNLKKILALVLALIMSLSLMATAGATDFKDDENVGDVYRQAVEVLSDLGVFNGDQNGNFNPEQPITRAEVAAIIYRIATGDVNNERNDSYAPYNQFPDIMEGDWYAGYVTYCANAGYVKGRNTGNFDPKDQVTGYEVLAMILRAVGYDKNNEFVGSNWQTNTASLATQKGVLKNITSATSLGAPATRETVAELLFRSILLPQVNWNSATLSYDANRETLAKENLNMEQVEGVVVANEWADLRYDYIDVDADQTVLKTANGERTLAVGTDLTDIGESRYAYVQNGSKVLGKLEDTGLNTVKDCVDLDPQGKGTSVGALAGNLSLTNAEYYVNFGDVPADTSEYRIEYSVSFRNEDALEWFESRYLGQSANNPVELEKLVDDENAEYDRNSKDVEYLHYGPVSDYYEDAAGNKIAGNETGRTFSRIIPAGDKITALDVAIMKGIFASAASFDSAHKDFSALTEDVVHAGYVYAGTKTNPDTSDRKDDLSDGHTYQWFADNYINTDPTAYFTSTTNGVWLKVIDNDSNGKADYVLATIYDLVEVDSYNERTGVYTFTGTADSDDAVCRDGEYEFAVGDMLLGAWIDGQYVVEEPKSEIVVIEKYSWKDLSVTTKDGAVLYESGADIDNTTGYADRIADMQYGIEYEVFYDHYGFIRAYRPVSSDRNYGLLTDLYLTNYRNTHYIDDQTATVELSFVDENGKLNINEYDVANHSKAEPNIFVGVEQAVYNHANGTPLNDTDNLQRAIAHLGMYTGNNVARFVKTWNNSNNKYAGSYLGTEFDYDLTANTLTDDLDGDRVNDTSKQANESNIFDASYDADRNIDFSWTNVARYTITEDGKQVNLGTATEYAYDKAGNQMFYWYGTTAAEQTNLWTVGGISQNVTDWREDYAELVGKKASDKDVIDYVDTKLVPVYAVDYVMLDKTNNGATTIGAGTYRFKIDNDYNNGTNLYNWHVNAVDDTVFYVVTPKNIYPVVGYKNLPTIKTSNIHAMYAVAENIGWDNAQTDYWVGNVIVIETTAELDGVYGHMIYNVYDNYRAGQRGIIHELDAIDCTTGQLVKVVVDSAWTQPYANGFYLLSDAEVAEDGTISATGMISVEKDKETNGYSYANYGIYAGEVVRSNSIESRASYIEVFDETNDKNVQGDEVRVELTGAPWYSVHGTAAEAAKSAGRLTATQLADRDYSGNQPNGDEVIYVKYGNKVTFIIDTTFGYTGWVAPAYLTSHDAAYTAGDVFDTAMIEQTGPVDAGKIVFNTNFVEYIDADGKVQAFPVPNAITSFATTTDANGVVKAEILLSGLKVGTGANEKAFAAPDGYELDTVTVDSKNYEVQYDQVAGKITLKGLNKYNLKNGATVTLNYKVDEGSIAATRLPVIADAEENGFGLPKADYSIDGIKLVEKAARAVVEDPQPGDKVELYFTVADTYSVKDVTINAPASIKGTYEVDTKNGTVGSSAVVSGIQYYITFTMPAGVIDLTINATNKFGNVMISVPENTTLADANDGGSGNVATIAKDSALKDVKLKLKASGYSLPTTVAIKVGDRTLVNGTDYTYVASTGIITFAESAKTADGAIIITGTAKADAAVLTVTNTDTFADLSTVVVAQSGETVKKNPSNSAYTWDLEAGVKYTITVTPKAKDKNIVSDVQIGGTSATENENGTWTLEVATAATGTKDIAVTYTPTEAQITITVTNSGTVEKVEQDGAEIEAAAGKYTVSTQSNVSITVKAATGKTFLKAPTATGLTATKNADGTYTLTGKVTGNVTVDDTYYPTTVTVTPDTGMSFDPSNGTVTLTVQSDGTATASLTWKVTAAGTTLVDEGDGTIFSKSFTLTAPSSTGLGGTYTLSQTTIKVTGTSATMDNDATGSITITFTPDRT